MHLAGSHFLYVFHPYLVTQKHLLLENIYICLEFSFPQQTSDFRSGKPIQ